MVQRVFTFAAGFCVLIGLALAGAWASSRLPLGLPGPIVGLAAYIALLVAMPKLETLTRSAAEQLLQWLGLLITPAAVGLALHADRLASEVGRLALVIVVSTIVTGLATAYAYKRLKTCLG